MFKFVLHFELLNLRKLSWSKRIYRQFYRFSFSIFVLFFIALIYTTEKIEKRFK